MFVVSICLFSISILVFKKVCLMHYLKVDDLYYTTKVGFLLTTSTLKYSLQFQVFSFNDPGTSLLVMHNIFPSSISAHFVAYYLWLTVVNYFFSLFGLQLYLLISM